MVGQPPSVAAVFLTGAALLVAALVTILHFTGSPPPEDIPAPMHDPDIPGAVTDAPFGQAASFPFCAPTYGWDTLSRQLEYGDQPRNGTIALRVNPTAAANWTFIMDWSLTHYGVRLVQDADGIPVVNVPGPIANPEGEGWRRGQLNHDQVYLQDVSGNHIRFGTLYRVEVVAGAEDAESVILHELGHALGLNHVPNAGNVMAPGIGEVGLGIHDCHRLALALLKEAGP